MYRIWNFFLTHRQFTALVMIGVVLAGFISLATIPKESSPEVTIPIAVVITTMPGASAAEVETLVTNVLERPLKSNLEHVDTLTSTSRESVSSITVQFDASADLQESIQKLRDQVQTAKTKLPTDAKDPQVIQIDFASQPVSTISISANLPEPALFTLGKDVQKQLESVRGVSSVSVGGLRDKQVRVLLKKNALAQYGLSAASVAQAIGAQNSTIPAGTVKVNGVSYPMRFAGDLLSADDIKNTPIPTPTGSVVYVSDVADVVDGYAPATTISRSSFDGAPSEPSLSLSVFKARGSNITDVSKAVNAKLASLEAEGGILENANAKVTFDMATDIFDNLSELTRSGLIATLLVVLLLAFTIGWREALIAGSSIPISLLATFAIMKYSGNSLNVVSLFSLVLTIGIIVDTATVVMMPAVSGR
jgi:HAE1 family hydrophobic/amphiphilic exporter-1